MEFEKDNQKVTEDSNNKDDVKKEDINIEDKNLIYLELSIKLKNKEKLL